MRTSAALAALLLAGACARPAQPPVKTPEAQLMEWKGQHGGAQAGSAKVIQDQAAWEGLWQELRQPAPQVDFKDVFAVAVFLGERNTGGYTIAFLPPVEEKGALVIPFRENEPTGMALQALTRPYAIKLFPKSVLPVKTRLEK